MSASEPITASDPKRVLVVEGDRDLGLELGADDSVTEPFSPRELTARITAVLRRAGGAPQAPSVQPFRAGGLGLAIAKGLVEAQQGTIAVSNHPGGCCFTVRPPLAGGPDGV